MPKFSESLCTSEAVNMPEGGRLEHSLQFNVTILFPVSFTHTCFIQAVMSVLFGEKRNFVDASYILIHVILLKLIRRETKHDFQLSFMISSFSYHNWITFLLLLDHSIEPGNLVFPFMALAYLTCLTRYI